MFGLCTPWASAMSSAFTASPLSQKASPPSSTSWASYVAFIVWITIKLASVAPLICGRSFTDQAGRAEQEYRKFAGPGIPDKGDGNDLLRYHFPDMSQARAALDALPKFVPGLKPQPVRKPSKEIDHDQHGRDVVKDEHYDMSKAAPLIHQLRDRGGDECRASSSRQESWRKYSGKYHGRKRRRPRRFNQSLENHSAHSQWALCGNE